MSEDKKSILVVGSAAYDTLYTPAGNENDALGGSSFYFSTAASLYAPVRLVAVMGSDFDFSHIDFLKDKDVDMEGLEVKDGKTFRWGGRYYDDPNKRDTLFTELGVFENFDPKIPEHYRNTEFVFLGNIHPALQLKVLDQMEKPELVVLDTMNLWIDITKDLLNEVISKVDVLIVNDEEALQLTGIHNAQDAANDLISRGPRTVVIKKGQHGAALYLKDSKPFFVPAYPVKAVKDPTGAGDTFAAAFIGYLSSRDLADPEVWRNAIVHGTVVASFVVEDFSMRKTQVLTNEEIGDRIKDFHSMTTFKV
jgi:sugar/nucleoside kinase (ribokinase family)